jgi:hypothetical protein
MILINGLVAFFVLMSLIALIASASEWVIYGNRRARVLVAMSGFLFVFWGSILAFLASR